MPTYATEAIRNVILLSHSGAGKTTLVESMLFSAGAISRVGKIDAGNTTSDYEPEEAKRQISIGLSILPLTRNDTKINVMDAPGYADFVGEVKAGLWAADSACVVICAASGVEIGTEQMWGYIVERNMPSIIFVNKMDRDNADFYRTLEDIESKLGKKCVAIQLPIGSQADFEGVVDLLTGKAYKGSDGKEEAAPSSMGDQIKSFYEKLVESVAEVDDDLMMKYLEGEEISSDEVCAALKKGAKSGAIVPVVVGSGLQSVGISQFLNAICEYIPSPKDIEKISVTDQATKDPATISPDANNNLVALVFKTSVDPYVGRLTYIRVFSGMITSNSQVWNANKGQSERIGQLLQLRGKTQEPITELVAGDIGAIAKLAVTNSGDTLCVQSHPMLLPYSEAANPNFTVALYPKTKTDVDKLGTALPRLLEEDAYLQVRRDIDTGETILAGMGDTHIDVAVERLQRKLGVGVDVKVPKVSYKETISVPTRADYKHKKQTGGHGQYGHVVLEMEPLSRGGGFEFTEKVVGGSVPKNYVPAVEKGVTDAMSDGVLGGFPVVDVRIKLVDGSSHPVDSSEMSFKLAGAQAVRKGLAQGQPVLVEPIMKLQVDVPEAFTGDIISDLNTKRGRVLGMIPQDNGQIVEAEIPLAEVLRYSIDLRSITQGRGTYSLEFSHYEEVPAHLAQKIIEEKSAEKEKS